ncbi:ABC transporter ATP-binding protein [Iodidimonas nitroreducens]|uniref:ABC transporter ATP-binding protein n=1 Tax=Iodidimonas nitroreducens TaxID=1236968 RepID=A0A5A7N858_9PROT|nr:ABC transporter ATP-binding protein [Iodidimonas nitroreducens]GAK34092.1 putative ABC transporter ATP-binding protein YbhF [alpha proteobacterium Q-1]GER03815.1 ABC transporter ATP-binding protein [Iodidimonas nitroreducens]
MHENSLIKARGLSRAFGPFLAVDGLSLDVGKGEVLGFLGPNGAGKTTSMKMLTGFLPATAGDVEICGIDIKKNPVAARRHLGYLPEGAPLYDDMTVDAFLHFIARARGLAGDAADRACQRAARAVNLLSVLGQPIDTLSKGYRRRVGLAQAIVHDPDVLILDEPTDGLDPNQKYEVRRLIEQMAPHKAILISTHVLEEVEALCTRAVIIDRGRIVADGTPSELKSRSRYHHALMIEIDEKDAAQSRAALADLPGLSDIEQLDGHGLSRLTLFPEKGGDILDAARQRLGDQGIMIRQISLEAGRLDDVFRALTHNDLEQTRISTTEDAA